MAEAKAAQDKVDAAKAAADKVEADRIAEEKRLKDEADAKAKQAVQDKLNELAIEAARIEREKKEAALAAQKVKDDAAALELKKA